jgi:hypothetical protein
MVEEGTARAILSHSNGSRLGAKAAPVVFHGWVAMLFFVRVHRALTASASGGIVREQVFGSGAAGVTPLLNDGLPFS